MDKLATLCIIVFLALMPILSVVKIPVQAQSSTRQNWNDQYYWDDPSHNSTVMVENITNLLSPAWAPATASFSLSINPVTDRWFAEDFLINGHRAYYYSDNEGNTWNLIGWQNLTFPFVSPTPNFPNVFLDNGTALAFNYRNMYRSGDDGITWSLVFNSSIYPGSRSGVALGGLCTDGQEGGFYSGAYNSTLIFAGEYGGAPTTYPQPCYVWKSTDNAQTWTVGLNATQFLIDWYSQHRQEPYYPVNNQTHVHDVFADRYTGRIWVSVGDIGVPSLSPSIVYSDDFGQTWNALVDTYNSTISPSIRPIGITSLKDRLIFGEDFAGNTFGVYLDSEQSFYNSIHKNATFDTITKLGGIYSYGWQVWVHNGVVYGELDPHGGNNFGGIWASIDGFSWYWAYKTSNVTAQTLMMTQDSQYVYFQDVNDGHMYRMAWLTTNEVAYLTRRTQADSGTLMTGWGGDENYVYMNETATQWTITFTGRSRTNLIANPSFEVNTNPSNPPDNWTVTTNANVTWATKSDIPYQGNYYLVVNANGTTAYITPTLLSNPQSGKPYIINFRWMSNQTKTPADTTATLWMFFTGSSFHREIYLNNTKIGWQQMLYGFTPSGTLSSFKWYCFTNATWLDNVFLGTAEDADPIYPWINGTQSTTNTTVQVESNGQNQTFNVGNLANGETKVFQGTIPLSDIVKLNATIGGSYVVDYGIVDTTPTPSPTSSPTPTATSNPPGTTYYPTNSTAPSGVTFQIQNVNFGNVRVNQTGTVTLTFTYSGSPFTIMDITLSSPFNGWISTSNLQAPYYSQTSGTGQIALPFAIPADVADGAYTGTVQVSALDCFGTMHVSSAKITVTVGESISVTDASDWIRTHLLIVGLGIAAMFAVLGCVAVFSRRRH